MVCYRLIDGLLEAFLAGKSWLIKPGLKHRKFSAAGVAIAQSDRNPMSASKASPGRSVVFKKSI
jgi:hypothetical protein